jgi:Periplasmic protease
MKKYSFIVIAVIVLMAACQSGTPKVFPNQYIDSDKLIGLSRLWSEIKYNFVNIDQIEFDIDSLYEVAVTKVLNTNNDIEYFRELDLFLAAFNDGHTQILRTSYSWNDYFDYIPCIIIEVDKKFYFTNIKKGIEIDSTFLCAEIIEVEGMPTLEYIETNIFPYVSASTYSHKLMIATTKLMSGIQYTYFNGKAVKQNGEVVNFSICRNGEATRDDDNDKSWGEEINGTFHTGEQIALNWQDENIAILQINNFTESMIERIDFVFKEVVDGKAKGLILDLRYNGGGSTAVTRHLQWYLTKLDSIKYFGSQVRINNSYGRSQGNYREEYEDFYKNKAYETEPSKAIYRNKSIASLDIPVVVICGKYTFSAAEDFMINIYEMPDRPLIIGESTGGSTGAPLVVALPHDAWARICTVRFTYPYSGELFVNKGVQPDIFVQQTLDAVITNKDIVMNEAIIQITKFLGR